MKEKYLPIGSVVLLENGSKRVMITGFCSMPENDEKKIYDYSGCMYPEGYVSSKQICLFDHNQISQIYHLGLVDEEEKEFKNKLNSIVSKMNFIDKV